MYVRRAYASQCWGGLTSRDCCWGSLATTSSQRDRCFLLLESPMRSSASMLSRPSRRRRSGGLECGYLIGEASRLIVGDEGSAVFDRYEASVGESGVQPSGEVELEETVRGSPN